MAWNRPSEPVKPVKKNAPPSMLKGIAAGLLLVASLAAVLYVVLGRSPTPAAPQTSPKNSAAIKPTKPSVPKSAKRIGSVGGDVRPKSPAGAASVSDETAEPDAAAETNAAASAKSAPPEDNRLFKNPMDQLLAMVMPRRPGEAIPPLPAIDDVKFTPEEENAMLDRLAAADDDTDETLNRKELVQSLRDEYQELKKSRNWTFVDYVRALEAKVNLDADVLRESLKIHETVFNDKSISDEEYSKALAKINKVLSDRGIAPIGQREEEEDGESEAAESEKN